MYHILVVEDDRLNLRVLEFLLAGEGYEVTTCMTPSRALELLDVEHYDLIMLDIILPEMNGLDLCRRIRERFKTPIMFLSSLSDSKDRVIGLQAGGDDYLPKPFDPNEVLARTWALLRRINRLANSESSLKNADVIFDAMNNQVTLTRNGTIVTLTPIEAHLLHFLMSHAGRTLTRDALVIKVWGYEYDSNSNQLDVYISRLRSKLEETPADPKLIQTVRGVGYRLQPSTGSITRESKRAVASI